MNGYDPKITVKKAVIGLGRILGLRVVAEGIETESIYRRYMDVAKLSKFSGGIGVSFTRVRSRGSLIRSTG